MRRPLAVLLVLALLAFLAPPGVALAAEEPQVSDIQVSINGQMLDAVVLTLAGRTLVPFRAVGDALGATVGWEQATQTASLTLMDRTVALQIGAKVATVKQGAQTREVALDAPALLYQSRTYVPARFVAEGLGYAVNFDGTARVVLIGTPTVATAQDWRKYDLNGDERVDQADAQRMWEGGPWTAPRDLNADGRKDSLDMWDLLLKITQWDRTGDRAVDAEDFGPPAPIALPKADAKAAADLAKAMLAEVEKQIPADLELKLRQEWMGNNLADTGVLASLWEQAGMNALLLKNLEVAQWAFAKAAIASPGRDSALANLGFIQAQLGQHEEAMQLYAQARALNPDACVTNGNIAWVYARHGQLDEAVSYYRQAVAQCGQFAEYHLNLGAVLLKQGKLGEAQLQFAEAARLSPADQEALLMAVATNPAKPESMNSYQQAYEAEQEGYIKEGLIEWYQPWETLSASDRWEVIRSQIAEQVWKERDEQLKALGERTAELLMQIAEPALPKGESACDDLQRWAANSQMTFAAMQQAIMAADMEASGIATTARKKEAAMELSMGNMLLDMVMVEAQEAMVGAEPAQAKQVFEKYVHDYYERPMQWAQQQLSNANETEDLDIPGERDLAQAVLVGGLFLSMGTLSPGYSESLKGCGMQPGDAPKWEFKAGEESWGLSLAIVEVEWKPDSNEVKLQVGQGVMVAGTWSPGSGFGFQYGEGVDLDLGPFKAGASVWVKHGSDGSITVEAEGGAGGAMGPKWSGSASKTVRAATHEPIGSLN